MEPFTWALLASTAISAAGAATAAAQGGRSTAAAEAQNTLNWKNYYLQQREMQQKQEMARAASTDPLGNRTSYTPGVGWRTDATPQTENLLRSAQNEQQQQYSVDAPRNRLIAQQAFRRSQRAGGEADTALSELRNPRQTLEGTRGRMIESNVADAMVPTDNARRAIAMRAARGGGGGNMLDQLSSFTQPTTRSAIAKARLEAPSLFDTAEQNRRNAVTQRYTALNQSAAGQPTALTPVDTGIQSTMQNARLSGNQLESSIKAPQPFQITPMPNPLANGLGAMGATLGGAVDTLYASRRSEQNNALMQKILEQRINPGFGITPAKMQPNGGLGGLY